MIRQWGVLRALSALLLLGLLSACAPESAIQPIQGQTMGTTYSISYVGSASQQSALQERIEQRLQQINQAMSTYQSDSQISQFNRQQTDQWVSIDPGFAQVVALALQVSDNSQGAFDITVGPLVDLWGFGPQARPQSIPSDAQLQQARAQIGYQAIEVDLAGSQLRTTQPRRLDLSAIAKGYAVDQVAQLLLQQGITQFLVEIGGEMRLAGLKPDGQPWRIAIETPQADRRAVHQVLPLTDIGIATSGDYRNFFEQDGVRYSHTLDPSTGRPITHRLASVTVLADSAAEADAYATAFMVMGAEAALDLANRLHLGILLIEKGSDAFVTRTNADFDRVLAAHAPT